MFKWGNSLPIPDPRVNKSHKRIHSEMTRVPGTNPINRASSSSILIPGFVTPQLLYNYYNISSPYGPSLVSQAVYEIINDALNPDDLTNFQNFFSLPVTPIAQVIGGHVDTNACNPSVYSGCITSNLDTQYIMAVAQGTPTTYYYTDSEWDDWITDVANSSNPANIGYNSYEDFIATSVKDAFNIQAIKLGVMGTTILAASGDDGVIDFLNNCGYYPQFLASSPYVTAVDGTVGLESGNPEIACTSQISPTSVGITYAKLVLPKDLVVFVEDVEASLRTEKASHGNSYPCCLSCWFPIIWGWCVINSRAPSMSPK